MDCDENRKLMKKIFLQISPVLLLTFCSLMLHAQIGTLLPSLHVEGRYLKDTHGNVVNLHGFAQTYSPYFNERGKYWDNYDVQGCLTYNQGLIQDIVDAGWKVNFLRLHMDPYWSNSPGCTPDFHEAPNCFNETRFRKYLDEVFVPMAEYAVSKGLYVIMRPPGVCPPEIAVDDDYNNYLIQVWNIVSQHPKLRNHPNIMFELANEPINILGPNGDYGSGSQGHFDNLKIYFQSIVDVIRANGSDNILWVPGLGYQSRYKGFALNPIEGDNIGYAVHIYPGWLGSDGYNEDGGVGTGGGYESFKEGWDKDIQPVADFAPIVITEMDWADPNYNSSWGKGITGVAGGAGFGANMKKITDEAGNVSWLIFTEPHLLAQFTDVPPADGMSYTFLNDPEACPWPTYQWYEEYSQVNYPRPNFTKLSHSDNGDGTFTNPVIHGEFPDPDVIRVGDVYYMVSTTMHVFPGATILKSYDLVNWEFCSNPLELIEASDCYNLDPNCDTQTFRYGRGQWATAIAYNDGKYYLLFNTLDEGGYLLTATDPEGPWEQKKLPRGYYDAGILFDEGKIYIAHGIGTITITEVDNDFNVLQEQEVFTGSVKPGMEGTRLYKKNGHYYVYATYGGFPSYQVVWRSEDIWGNYEEKLLLDDDNIHQGALIETQTGEWWTLLFYDKMPYGRLPNLQPVQWVDDWPEIGEKLGDEFGDYRDFKGVKTYRKPNVGRDYPISTLATNDNFRDYKLGLQWGWNHNPDNSKWSLIDRPGYLRLKTASVADNLHEAKNTLTQRIFGYQSEEIPSYATIKMHINNMKEGDVAGLSAFTKPETSIGVKMQGGTKQLFVETDDATKWGPTLSANDTIVYLRVVTQYKENGANPGQFYYSLDNETYTALAPQFNLTYTYDFFMAPRFSIFNFSTTELGGYVDIDWFTTEESFSEDTFYDDSFVGYTEDQLTLEDLYVESHDIIMLVGTSKAMKVTALFKDGHTENVITTATITNSNPDKISLANGQLVAKDIGSAIITVTYEGKLGGTKSVQFEVSATLFPLTNELFNPSIWESGTFDEETSSLITGQYGFGGWEYNNSLDLSKYTHLIVKFSKPIAGGQFSLRLWDEGSYWAQPATADVADGTVSLEVNLRTLKKIENDQSKAIDLSRIYRIGFWSTGNIPIYIDEIYLFKDPSIPDEVSLVGIVSDGGESVNIEETYVVPENHEGSVASFIIETSPYSKVLVDGEELTNNILQVDVSKPSIQSIAFEVVSIDGLLAQSYTLKVEKRFVFDDIVVTRWNNTLIANANRGENGGFKFKEYKWYKDNVEVGTRQYYSEGPKRTDVLNGYYYVEFVTNDGQVLRAWEKEFHAKDLATMQAFPNPLRAAETAFIELSVEQASSENTIIEVYDINGNKISATKPTGIITPIVMPVSSGIYIIRLSTGKNVEEGKLIVK